MKKILLFFALIVLVPYIVVTVLMRREEVNFFFSSNTTVRVLRSTTNQIEVVPLEEYIMGVIAGEMPASFEMEALKAQAVASRSYVMYHMLKNKNKGYDVVDTVTNQVYLDSDTLKKRWGDRYEEYAEKIMTAVKETSYQYLVYKGQVAEALFFSTSTGYTENSEDVFVSSVPYLRSVPSPWDNISPAFSNSTDYSIEEFCKLLKLENSESIKTTILETTAAGRIKKIKINEKTLTGKEVASLLRLKSSFFSITVDKNRVYISTKGYGHGVGMSQYGAQGMASAGYSYEEILTYYYTGVEIKKIKN